MKLSLLILALAVILLADGVPLRAQTADDADAETTPPPGSTVITSDELHSDQANHVSVFTGKVVVVGNQFKMTCQEMTVNFTNDNKVDTIVATGDVVITQPNRITHCGHAEYFHEDDKFVLTDQPTILNGKDQITGTRITIFRTTQKMIVDGGRTNVILGPDSMGSSSTTKDAPSSTDTK
jgi:lipopolysaccharide export system protein LptA